MNERTTHDSFSVGSLSSGSAASMPGVGHREGILEIPGRVPLRHGDTLTEVRVGWRVSGKEGAPVVVALGGISADRRVYAPKESGVEGWWPAVVGPGLAVPVDRLRVLSFDYLGGGGESSGPRDGSAFPSVSSYDQADVLCRLLNHLGVRRLRAIVGASYGGMVALAFAERYPERVEQLVVISAAERAHPMATAWRSVQREMLRFALQQGRSADGVRLARSLAMATYRSAEEFSARFDSAPVREGDRFVFPVERYLLARGEEYARRHRPHSMLTLSESIDLHRVDAGLVNTPVMAIGIREDQLVPLADMRALVARLPQAQLHELSSVYGHDAFLKEGEALRTLLAPLWRTVKDTQPKEGNAND